MLFFSLPKLRLILLFRLIQGVHVTLRNQQLLGFLLDLSVFGIDRLLPGEEFRIFRRQFLYSRDLPDAQFIKCLFRCFVESDLFTVGLKELFAVSGFPVCLVGAAGLGIVDDVLLQCCDLRQTLLGLLNRREQFIPFCGSF